MQTVKWKSNLKKSYYKGFIIVRGKCSNFLSDHSAHNIILEHQRGRKNELFKTVTAKSCIILREDAYILVKTP